MVIPPPTVRLVAQAERRTNTLRGVTLLLHVELDERSVAALEVVLADGDGLDESEAVRTALQEAAARRRSRAGLRAELHAYGSDQPPGPD